MIYPLTISPHLHTQEVFSDLEASKYQHAEMRISIYGRKAMEWVSQRGGWVAGVHGARMLAVTHGAT
jgi:hypothetical protein